MINRIKAVKRRARRVLDKVKECNKCKRPVLSIYKSNKNIRAQIVDVNGKVLVAIASNKKDYKDKLKGKKGEEIAKFIGGELAKLAVSKKVKEVVFNKGAYKYIGRVKAFCEGARENGLLF